MFKQLLSTITAFWDARVLDVLRRYIEVPAKSKEFDPLWAENRFIHAAVAMAKSWVQSHAPKGTVVDVIDGFKNEKGEWRTPVLLIEVPATGTSGQDVFMYGHLDKQPECGDWDKTRGLEAWKAVDIKDEKGHRLYGRGGADDGYAVFAALSSILALEEDGIPHGRVVILIETGEESGSPDLPFYLEHLRECIGSPSLIVALDSGSGTYDRLWLTTTLRGLVVGVLDVQILREGVHSGDATGVVPDTFRIGRELIQHIEHARTGEIQIAALHADIPDSVEQEARAAAAAVGFDYITRFPWVEGTCPMPPDGDWLMTKILARTWEPGLTVTGIDGMPSVEQGGNVRRPGTRFKLSIRIPPSVNADEAAHAVERVILLAAESQPAKITFTASGHSAWMSPPEAQWLTRAVDEASMGVFGKPAARMGEGGSIPFMGQLTDAYPNAQFVVTGVLGPESNAHGPNEFINVDYAKCVTAAVAHIVAAHEAHFAG